MPLVTMDKVGARWRLSGGLGGSTGVLHAAADRMGCLVFGSHFLIVSSILWLNGPFYLDCINKSLAFNHC
jgi:hypothetical protein